jgi:hypothetical protein
MELNELLLKKEELPIIDNSFLVPIHPKLLRSDIKIDTNATDTFKKAIEESLNEVSHVRDLYYEVRGLENGLADSFFLNSHVGIFINKSLRVPLGLPYVKFSQDKQEEFMQEKENNYLLDNGPPFGYIPKNVESSRTDAVLLRNWAMLYLNEVMEEIF